MPSPLGESNLVRLRNHVDLVVDVVLEHLPARGAGHADEGQVRWALPRSEGSSTVEVEHDLGDGAPRSSLIIRRRPSLWRPGRARPEILDALRSPVSQGSSPSALLTPGETR